MNGVHKVAENLFRGPRPKDLRHLINTYKVQRVIVLQSGAEDKMTDSLYEAQLIVCESDANVYPVDVIRIPCSNIFPPTIDAVEEFLDYAQDAVADGVVTYFHCHAGVDRTGFMALWYRIIFDGWSKDKALQEWKELGRHWWFGWWRIWIEIFY